MHDNDRRSMPSGSGENNCGHIANSCKKTRLWLYGVDVVVRDQIQAGDAQAESCFRTVKTLDCSLSESYQASEARKPACRTLCKHSGISTVYSKGDT